MDEGAGWCGFPVEEAGGQLETITETGDGCLSRRGFRSNSEYTRDVRPILTANCFKCHGPAAKKGGFRLDVREDATKPAKSGAKPIVEGKPGESELVKRIFSKDTDEVMPPTSSHK